MELSYLNVVTLVFIGTSILPLLNVDGFGFKFNSYKKFIVTQEIKDDSVPDSLSVSGNQNSEYKSQKSFVTDDFAWKSCGPKSQLVEIRNLTFEPSPLVFPGVMTFGFDVIFHDTINSNASVSAKLALQYRRGSGTWIPIPCIGQIGSCNYTDICALTKGISCPPDLQQKGIPCTCPFNKGEYTLDHYDVEIDAAVFLAGNYQGQINLNDKDKGQIACYIVNFTIG